MSDNFVVEKIEEDGNPGLAISLDLPQAVFTINLFMRSESVRDKLHDRFSSEEGQAEFREQFKEEIAAVNDIISEEESKQFLLPEGEKDE